jgi:hypothetical protein
MSSSYRQSSNGRAGRALIALVALAATAGALAIPASAASGQGTAAIVLAQHDKGRTLSGQGVKVLPGLPASKDGHTLTLPIAAVDAGANPTATGEGSLSFKRGKRSVDLTGLSFDLGAGTLSGKLGDEEIDVFKLGAAASVDAAAGSVALQEGKLRLTREAAKALKSALKLGRTPATRGVGMVWLVARATPASSPAAQAAERPAAPEKPGHEAPKAVLAGNTEWGLLASWRAYILGEFGPGSVGTIATGGGATASGALTSPATVFGFPAATGSYEKGTGGASDNLTLEAEGNVVFTKLGHCIIELKAGDLEVVLDGADSSIVLDSVYDVGTPEGMSCGDLPAVPTANVTFADLDLSGVTPSYSDGGRTITWAAIPASLTAAGSTAFVGGQYPAGQPLDPITITAEIE